MDKGALVEKYQQNAIRFTHTNPYFVKTSRHRNWQGRVRCVYCKKTGYVTDNLGNEPWMKNHGMYCKKNGYTVNINSGTVHYVNTGITRGQVWVTTANTYNGNWTLLGTTSNGIQPLFNRYIQ